MRRLLRRLIEDGVARGEFNVQDPELAARLVHSAMIKFCHPMVVVEHMHEDLDGQARAMAIFLSGALRADVL